MASLNYLWSNRVKFPVNTKKFYHVWGKRAFSFPELLKRNWRRLKLIRKGAEIDKTAEIGHVKLEGVKSFLKIGAFSFLGRVYMALHDRIEIGEKVCINDGVKILTASHDVTDPKWNHVKEMVIIEDYVWIGMDALILPGVRLGRGCVVGAGSVVTRSVEPGAIVVGNPARQIPKSRCNEFDYDPCYFLAVNQAWLVG